MQIQAVEPLTPDEYMPYVARNMSEARRLLGEVNGLLASDPATLLPQTHVKQVVTTACNAAEHLYDLDQVNAPEEAVREALAAADAIVDTARTFEAGDHTIGRTLAAQQLLGIDRTLATLEHTLGIPHVGV